LFLFILESIGTPELILIAIVALIVLGPRKLPQIAKTVAKTMAEFRNATNEFKTTWEKEVAFEDEIIPGVRTPILKEESETENTISRNNLELQDNNQFQPPQIKELTSEEIIQNFQNKETTTEEAQLQESKSEPTTSNKRDWL
jgi:sec-independent protein translocase protein TatA